jgi:hypothetical protein
MDVADEQANDKAFGRPGSSRGSSAYPQFRFVCLVESRTHVLFGTRMSPYATGESTLAKEVLTLVALNFSGRIVIHSKLP